MAIGYSSVLDMELRQVCRTVHFDLISALWAMEDALNGPRTNFYYNTRALLTNRNIRYGDSFAEANLRGLSVAPVVGGASDIQLNLVSVYAAIRAYVEGWTEGLNGHYFRMTVDDTAFVYYDTLEEFAAVAGAEYTSVPSGWIWNDAQGKYWTSAIKLLNAMRTFAVLPVVEQGTFQGGFGDDGSVVLPFSFGTRQNAWDEALAETDPDTNPFFGVQMWLDSESGSGRVYHAYQWTDVSASTNHAKALATDVLGDYSTESEAVLLLRCDNMTGSVDIDVNGTGFTLTGNSDTIATADITYSSGSDTYIPVTVDGTLPTTQPFSTASHGDGQGIVGVLPNNDEAFTTSIGFLDFDTRCRFITDLSSALDA